MSAVLLFLLPFLSGYSASYVSTRSPYYLVLVVMGPIIFGLVMALKKWRGDKITLDDMGKGLRQNLMDLKHGSVPPSDNKAEINRTVLDRIGGSCPKCGAAAGAGALICSHCGSPIPAALNQAPPSQFQAMAAQSLTGSSLKCPSCGAAVVATAQNCPECNWRLHKTADTSGHIQPIECPSCGTMVAADVQNCPECSWRLHKSAGLSEEPRPHIGIVRRDVMIGGVLAFNKDEWVNIESESPDPERPEFKYIVRSKTLDKRFRLSDNDLSK